MNGMQMIFQQQFCDCMILNLFSEAWEVTGGQAKRFIYHLRVAFVYNIGSATLYVIYRDHAFLVNT